MKLFFSLLEDDTFIGNVRGNVCRVNSNVFDLFYAHKRRSIELDPPLAINKSNLFSNDKVIIRATRNWNTLPFNDIKTLINFARIIIEREAIQSDPYQRLQTSTRCLNRSKITSQELDQACRVWKHM